jgi:imidazolonepropionase-like amidohydrolase
MGVPGQVGWEVAMPFRLAGIRTTASSLAAVAALALGLAAAPEAQAPRTQASKRLALVGGMLLTGYDVPPIHHAAVLIEGNTIVQAGPASEVRIPPDATVIDTSGRTLLPGLIETHADARMLMSGPWIAHLAEAAAADSMQVGFGGLNISSPRSPSAVAK